MPDLTLRLTSHEATPGRVVDIVPSHGNVHLLATRAAISYIEPWCEEWMAPLNCRPVKLRLASGQCLVMITNVLPYRPGDKNQLKAQDVTAKLVRFDILRKVPKNNLFCINSLTAMVAYLRPLFFRASC